MVEIKVPCTRMGLHAAPQPDKVEYIRNFPGHIVARNTAILAHSDPRAILEGPDLQGS